ncbi:MAG: hypothetical protein NVSMB23_08660 [Myxococcales bacterium]
MPTRRGTPALAACLSILAAAAPSVAQERGRTDGPEGSEFGKGGYSSLSGSRDFSLSLSFGGAVQSDQSDGGRYGAPLFAGVTASFWPSDWVVFDLSGAYVASGRRFNALAGPRFRFPILYPMSLSAGLQAGVMVLKDAGARFGLSPNAMVDFEVTRRVLLGLGYAVDVPVSDNAGVVHRVFLSAGMRF